MVLQFRPFVFARLEGKVRPVEHCSELSVDHGGSSGHEDHHLDLLGRSLA
jgi:hypothetical protein